jgi:hypothetical protein
MEAPHGDQVQHLVIDPSVLAGQFWPLSDGTRHNAALRR